MNDEIVIKETTVGTVAGESVGCANIMEDSFRLSDGTVKNGLTAELHLMKENKKFTVGTGSRIDIGGKSYKVTEVQEASGEKKFGYVVLRPEDPH